MGRLLLLESFEFDQNALYLCPADLLLQGRRLINQNDLLIQQVVTNESDFQVSLKSFVTYPDRDRVEQTIPKLPPGETKTINYVIPDALQWLGQYIRIGLYDPKGTRRINHLVEIN